MKKPNAEISPSMVKLYRNAPRPTIADQIAGLGSFLLHKALFNTIGSMAAVAATERAWWQDAVILAALPASSPEEACRKLTALQPAFDRAWQTSGDGRRGYLTLITVAVEAERCRWALDAPTRH